MVSVTTADQLCVDHVIAGVGKSGVGETIDSDLTDLDLRTSSSNLANLSVMDARTSVDSELSVICGTGPPTVLSVDTRSG